MCEGCFRDSKGRRVAGTWRVFGVAPGGGTAVWEQAVSPPAMTRQRLKGVSEGDSGVTRTLTFWIL